MRDLIVIGGGITGAAAFRAAARAGLSVFLLDRGLAGGATTAVTSGLFHGGLRYLAHDVATSYSMCREISALLADKPDLLTRQMFLWPVYRHHKLGFGLVGSMMEYYDRFAGLRSSPGHFRLSAGETLERVPALEGAGLEGSFAFDEWRVDVPCLVRSLLDEGKAAGGEVLEGRRVVGLVVKSGLVTAARIGVPRGGSIEFHSRVFLNAGGPWAGEVAALAGSKAVKLSLRRGAHLIVPHEPPGCGLIFPEPSGRYIGLYPRDGEFWVGPTDDPHEAGPDQVLSSHEESERLRRSLATVLPGYPRDSGRTVVGLRPIFKQFMSGGMLSRDYRIIDHASEGIDNLVTVVGGKLTSHRPMAEDSLAAILPKLDRMPSSGKSQSPTYGLPASRLLSTRSRLASLALSAGLLAYHGLRHALSKPDPDRGGEGFRKAFPEK
ncbi:MAG: FAD-dependent oxidoreductase [Elusimicrobia bacterium]|nr:FAD-dependent oxidoreductase [Elusimicrobiota bacterium]